MAKEKKMNYGDMTTADLKKSLLELRRAQFNLRFRQSQGNLEKPRELGVNRRNIARIKTYLTIKNQQEPVQKPAAKPQGASMGASISKPQKKSMNKTTKKKKV